MKTKFHYLILPLALAFSTPKANAQTLIQFWDFNQTPPVGGNSGGITNDSLGNSVTPLTANYVATGLTAGHMIYSRPSKIFGSPGGKRDSICDNGVGGAFIYDYSSVHYSYVTSDDSTADGGNMYIRARNPSDSCEFTMYIPTTGYKNISMQFAISNSSSGSAQYNIFSYSTNGGTTWKNLTQAMDTFNISGVRMPDTLLMTNPTTDAGSWYPVQIDFTTDASVNNNANFEVRFREAGSNSSQPSHNDRYDNFAVWGTVVSGINELSAQSAGYTIYPNPTATDVNVISANYTGAKVITLYNVVGQIISTTQNQDKQTTIDMSSLSTGSYIIEVKELGTGNSYTQKIVKE